MSPTALPLVTYVFITTFTPGPNNITATTAGLSLGLRKSLNFLFGITAGFFVVMLLSGYFDFLLQSKYSSAAVYIKWIGFLYMIWLCASLFIKKGKTEKKSLVYSFVNGMLLQLVNPKVILYGLTLYGMFAKTLAVSAVGITLSGLCLSLVGFVSVLAWCSLGSAITRWLNDRRILMAFNILMAVLLLYAAFSVILD